MAHFVCEGTCKVSMENPGFCGDINCSNQGQALKECGCEDGEHKELFGGEDEGAMDEQMAA